MPHCPGSRVQQKITLRLMVNSLGTSQRRTKKKTSSHASSIAVRNLIISSAPVWTLNFVRCVIINVMISDWKLQCCCSAHTFHMPLHSIKVRWFISIYVSRRPIAGMIVQWCCNRSVAEGKLAFIKYYFVKLHIARNPLVVRTRRALGPIRFFFANNLSALKCSLKYVKK